MSNPSVSSGTMPKNYATSPYGITTGHTITTSDNSGGVIAAPHVIDGTSSLSTALRIEDDMDLEFSDGTAVTGKEFRLYMKMLRKIAIVEYPEEFI